MTKAERTKALDNARNKGWTLEKITSELKLDSNRVRIAHTCDNRDSHALSVIDNFLEQSGFCKTTEATKQPPTLKQIKPYDVLAMPMREFMLGVMLGAFKVFVASKSSGSEL
jgi:hypothetical protein